MSVLAEVLGELRSMFLSDGRMSFAIVLLVILAGAMAEADLPNVALELVLLFGAMTIVALAIVSSGRKRR